jgi:hypothetical protein
MKVWVEFRWLKIASNGWIMERLSEFFKPENLLVR